MARSIVLLETCPDQPGGYREEYLAGCFRGWVAVTRKVVKGFNNQMIPKGTVIHGFFGSSKADVATHIADRVADGDWPRNTLKPVAVIDCRLNARRVI